MHQAKEDELYEWRQIVEVHLPAVLVSSRRKKAEQRSKKRLVGDESTAYEREAAHTRIEVSDRRLPQQDFL